MKYIDDINAKRSQLQEKQEDNAKIEKIVNAVNDVKTSVDNNQSRLNELSSKSIKSVDDMTKLQERHDKLVSDLSESSRKQQDSLNQLVKEVKDTLETVKNIKLPDFPTPQFTVPDIKLPDIKIPNITIPEIKSPDVIVPDIVIPEIKIPQIIVPEIKIPEINVPETIVNVETRLEELIEFLADPKNPVAVRLSNGKNFFDQLTQAVVAGGQDSRLHFDGGHLLVEAHVDDVSTASNQTNGSQKTQVVDANGNSHVFENYGLYAVDSDDATYFYVMYQNQTGAWIIIRITLIGGITVYAKGTSGASTNWTGRAGLTYADYATTFN